MLPTAVAVDDFSHDYHSEAGLPLGGVVAGSSLCQHGLSSRRTSVKPGVFVGDVDNINDESDVGDDDDNDKSGDDEDNGNDNVDDGDEESSLKQPKLKTPMKSSMPTMAKTRMANRIKIPTCQQRTQRHRQRDI